MPAIPFPYLLFSFLWPRENTKRALFDKLGRKSVINGRSESLFSDDRTTETGDERLCIAVALKISAPNCGSTQIH